MLASQTPNWKRTLAWPVSSVSQPVRFRQITTGFVTFFPFGPKIDSVVNSSPHTNCTQTTLLFRAKRKHHFYLYKHKPFQNLIEIFQNVFIPLTAHLKTGLSTKSLLWMVLWNFLIVQIFLKTNSEATGASNSSEMLPTSLSRSSSLWRGFFFVWLGIALQQKEIGEIGFGKNMSGTWGSPFCCQQNHNGIVCCVSVSRCFKWFRR